MKVCIYGAGAVGGHVAVRLLSSGNCEVAVVARGAQLQAIRAHGITLRSNGNEIIAKPDAATDDPATLPMQDFVIITLKATALPAAAASIARLLAPQGCALFLLNGVPWWWNHGMPGGGGTLPLLDPDGALWNTVRPERAIGGIVHSPNDLVAPGVIEHSGANHLILGEPDGSRSARLEALAGPLRQGGIEIELAEDFRKEFWLKLIQNASGNTLAGLTRLALPGLSADPEIRGLMVSIMCELLEVAAALGWNLRNEIDAEKIARRGIGRAAGVRSSMLQDAMQGRPTEVDALLGQPREFAREKGIATPTMDVILPLLRGLNRSFQAS